MKKILIFMAAASLLLTSCDDFFKNQVEEKPNDQIENPDNNGDPMEELTPNEQKARLEEVAENLMAEYPAGDFDQFFKMVSRFNEKYFESVNDQYWDSFFEYCEEKGEEMFFFSEDESEKNGEIYYSWNVEAFLEFSDLHGILTLGEQSASCKDYDGTKVVFSLDGNDYVAEMKASGKTETAIYRHEDIYGYENYDGYYDYENGYWVDNYVMVHYNDSFYFEVSVPEKVNITLTKNGKDYASVEVAFARRFSEEGVSITTDCFQITTTVTIDGHSVVIEKTGYDAATGKAEVSCCLKKGSDEIVKAVAAADVKVKFITETDEWGSGYSDYTYPEFTLAKNFDLYFDVLGQLQVIGKCTDGVALAEYIENFYDASNSSQAERALDNINNYIDLGLYYDKSVTRQAELVMDYYVEEDD